MPAAGEPPTPRVSNGASSLLHGDLVKATGDSFVLPTLTPTPVVQSAPVASPRPGTSASVRPFSERLGTATPRARLLNSRDPVAGGGTAVAKASADDEADAALGAAQAPEAEAVPRPPPTARPAPPSSRGSRRSVASSRMSRASKASFDDRSPIIVSFRRKIMERSPRGPFETTYRIFRNQTDGNSSATKVSKAEFVKGVESLGLGAEPGQLEKLVRKFTDNHGSVDLALFSAAVWGNDYGFTSADEATGFFRHFLNSTRKVLAPIEGQPPLPFSEEACEELLRRKLEERTRGHGGFLREAFDLDHGTRNRTEGMTYGELRECLRRLNVSLSEEEGARMGRRYDPQGTGRVLWIDLLRSVAQSDYPPNLVVYPAVESLATPRNKAYLQATVLKGPLPLFAPPAPLDAPGPAPPPLPSPRPPTSHGGPPPTAGRRARRGAR
eukprot:tig00000865_g5096.t1